MMRNRRTSGNRVGPTGSKTGSSSSPAGRHILDVPGFGTNGRGGTWVPFVQPTPDHVAGDSMAPIFSQTLYNSTGGQVPAGIQGHFGTTHAAQPPSLGTLPEGMHPSQVVHSITANQLYTNYSYAYARPDGSFTRLVPADEISPIKDIPHTQGPDGLIILPEPCGISPKTQRQLQVCISICHLLSFGLQFGCQVMCVLRVLLTYFCRWLLAPLMMVVIVVVTVVTL